MANATEINILCAANSNYASPLSVMLASVFHSLARGCRVNLFIISDGLTEKDRAGILGSVPPESCATHWLEPDVSKLEGLDVEGHGGVAAYLRLLAPFLLPETCGRIIYLDCDLIVRKDLSLLWASTDDGALLHAAQDISIPFVSSDSGVFNYGQMGISATAPYFNTGVLVMNLKRWRAEGVTPRAVEYLRNHFGNVRYWDQGGLNAILHGQWKQLDPRWNQTHAVLSQELWSKAGHTMQDYHAARYAPFIIHFSGSIKPWQAECRDPRKSAFFKYLAMTAWRDSAPPRPWLEKLLGSERYYALRTLKHRLRSH